MTLALRRPRQDVPESVATLGYIVRAAHQSGNWQLKDDVGVMCGCAGGSQGVRTQPGKGRVVASLKVGKRGGRSNEEEHGHLKKKRQCSEPGGELYLPTAQK